MLIGTQVGRKTSDRDTHKDTHLMLCIVSSCCHPKRVFLCEEKVMSRLEASITINVVAV